MAEAFRSRAPSLTPSTLGQMQDGNVGSRFTPSDSVLSVDDDTGDAIVYSGGGAASFYSGTWHPGGGRRPQPRFQNWRRFCGEPAAKASSWRNAESHSFFPGPSTRLSRVRSADSSLYADR